MTTLYTVHVSNPNNYVEPRWMREERYMYCEPMTKSVSAFWARLKRFFL